MIDEVNNLRDVHAGNSDFAKGIDFGIDLVLSILKRRDGEEAECTKEQ